MYLRAFKLLFIAIRENITPRGDGNWRNTISTR